jgi:hypothetical protein
VLGQGYSAARERDALIGDLDTRDVREQRANRVARRVVQVIQLRRRQPFDGAQCRPARVRHHGDDTADAGRIAGRWTDHERVELLHGTPVREECWFGG